MCDDVEHGATGLPIISRVIRLVVEFDRITHCKKNIHTFVKHGATCYYLLKSQMLLS